MRNWPEPVFVWHDAAEGIAAVLKVANKNVKYCYEKALEASERASEAGTLTEREFYLDAEKR